MSGRLSEWWWWCAAGLVLLVGVAGVWWLVWTGSDTDEVAEVGQPEPVEVSATTATITDRGDDQQEVTVDDVPGVSAAPEVVVSTGPVREDAEEVAGGPGDCWGGALDGEPMACHVLGSAQGDGLVEVAGVFVAPNGPVYVMLAQIEPADDVVFRALAEYYKEFILSPQWAEAYKLYRLCDEFDSLDTCVEEVYSKRSFAPRFGPTNLYSPVSGTNDKVFLLTGGIEARQREPGWASWRRLWPDVGTGGDGVSAQAAEAGAQETDDDFDVSDVDMVSGLADEDCESHYPVVSDRYCVAWRRFGHLGFVSSSGTSIYFPDMTPTEYVQVKSPPSDAEAVREWKLELLDEFDRGRFLSGDLDIELIPVKYDLGELWRWAVILDRFKYSKSNTIGLTDAWLATNGVVLQRPQDIRVTINASFMDHRVGRAGLPDVLAALGIPADAVGWVRQDLDYYPSDPQPDQAGDIGGQENLAGARSDG